MPDERAIRRIEELLTDITRLGGQSERTSIVSNLTVVDIAPAGLTNFITIADERDGDTILAKTVPGIIYAVSDKVNVLFVEGTEPIAFQQGSESPSAGLWQIVPSTSTDIFYNSGNVGIGNTTPSALIDADQSNSGGAKPVLKLDQGDTSEQCIQFSSDSVDRDINLYTVDVTGTPTMFWDESDDTFRWDKGLVVNTASGFSSEQFELAGANDTHIMNVTTTITTATSPQILRFVPTIDPSGIIANVFGVNTNPFVAGTSSNNITAMRLYNSDMRFGGSYGGILSNLYNYYAGNPADGSSGAPAITNNYGLFIEDLTLASNNWGIYVNGITLDSFIEGNLGVGIDAPIAKLHVDQSDAAPATAIPTLYLDQADLSEEMIEFNTTIGVGNPIEAIGAKTLTTTHFIKVTIPGGLTRYFPVGTIA